MTAGDFTPLVGFKATKELLSRNRKFTAVLYAGDLMAVGGLRALKEVGLSVPEQVSVIGFYNGAIAQFSDPPLTTINLDRKRVGEVAAQRLLNMLDHNDFESLRIVMPMRLILRASTGRLDED